MRRRKLIVLEGGSGVRPPRATLAVDHQVARAFFRQMTAGHSAPIPERPRLRLIRGTRS